MIAKPQLCKTAKNEIRDLRQDYGVELTIEEILWLHELGKKLESPSGDDRRFAIGMPAKAGNVYLWPFTVGASIWWQDCGIPWFGESGEYFGSYSLAFCLAHARGAETPIRSIDGWVERIVRKAAGESNQSVLADLTDRVKAKKAIRNWALNIGCTFRELREAIEEVIPKVHVDTPTEKSEESEVISKVDWEAIANTIALQTGTDPQYWIWKTSEDSCLKAYAQASRQEAARISHGRAAGDLNPTTQAIDNLTKARVQILTDRGIDLTAKPKEATDNG